MERACMSYLKQWLTSSIRKPLVIQGARQVGKTWLVRHFAETTGKELIEINLEERSDLTQFFFETDEPQEIVASIGKKLGIEIDPYESILFIDEIQQEPEFIAQLRWFYEDMPELPVITAGSLLNFAFGVAPISMPVGRISFMYVEPLSFIEFLLALERDQLVELIQTYTWGEKINIGIHEELMRLFKEYVYVGGLPKAVKNWAENFSEAEVNKTHHAIIERYRIDFRKYSERIDSKRLDEVFDAVPRLLGKKFVYRSVNPEADLRTIKKSLQLLCKAHVCHNVTCASVEDGMRGISKRARKVISIDAGLCSYQLGMSLRDLRHLNNGIAEQVVGQLLRTIIPFYVEPKLFYWARSGGAEIDYIIQHKGRVVPVEVKEDSAGALKSLHRFMRLKELLLACRVYSGLPSITDMSVKDTQGYQVNYQLRSIPFYLLSELPRLLD